MIRSLWTLKRKIGLDWLIRYVYNSSHRGFWFDGHWIDFVFVFLKNCKKQSIESMTYIGGTPPPMLKAGWISTQQISHLYTNALQQLHSYLVSTMPRPYDRQLISDAAKDKG